LIQFLIRHNHSWEAIKTYTLSELGVFIKEAKKEEEHLFRSKTLATWTGVHADEKQIQALINDSNITSNSASIKEGPKKVQDDAKTRGEWQRLAMALGGLK